MTHRVLALLATLVCFAFAAEGFAAGRLGRIPEYIASTLGPASYPPWISAEAVADKQGNLVWAALPSGLRLSAEQQLENGDYEKYGCFQVLSVSHHVAGPPVQHSSLKDLVHNSLAAFQGTITDIDQGFGAGSPGYLLEIQVEERLKTSDKFSSLPYLYPFYPKGEFTADGYHFCARDHRWPDPPQIGDRVLCFPFALPMILPIR